MIYSGDEIKLANFCETNLALTSKHYAVPYQSLGPCILDCVYSLRAKYFAVTVKVVDRYAQAFMKGRAHDPGYSLTDFLRHIQSTGSKSNFASNILNNRQKISGRLKSEICYDLAERLVYNKIETKSDFANANPAFIESIIRGVKGLGNAAVNYLFMLAGDPNRCKPDVHIHHCIRDATGHDVSDSECQTLFTEAVKILKAKHPALTVALLDGIVWNKYRV